MKFSEKTVMIASVIALSSTAAFAAITNVKDMSNGNSITIKGVVEDVKNEREFTLRDNTGKIDIDITSSESVVLKKGDSVTVSGVVDKGIFGSDINANKVTVNKNLARAVGDAIEGNTPISLEGAATYDIAKLPQQGLVKVSGTVTDVDNEKEFTLKDSTGSINVDVKSPETAALTEGAQVTVIGYVEHGMFSRDINASKVLVVADASNAR